MTTAKTYDIEIAEFYHALDIRAEAESIGVTHMREIANNGAYGDARVTFYGLPDPNYPGHEIRVAATNGDSVWEEQDLAVFADLARECGITLD